MSKTDNQGRDEEAHEKEKGEGLGPREDDESTTKPVEPDEPMATPTSNDVGEQTHTKANPAE